MWVLWLALFTRVLGMLAVKKSSPIHRTVPGMPSLRPCEMASARADELRSLVRGHVEIDQPLR